MDGFSESSSCRNSSRDIPVWAWQYSTRVYYMVSQPDAVILRAKRYEGNGYDESANEDVTLNFA